MFREGEEALSFGPARLCCCSCSCCPLPPAPSPSLPHRGYFRPPRFPVSLTALPGACFSVSRRSRTFFSLRRRLGCTLLPHKSPTVSGAGSSHLTCLPFGGSDVWDGLWGLPSHLVEEPGTRLGLRGFTRERPPQWPGALCRVLVTGHPLNPALIWGGGGARLRA